MMRDHGRPLPSRGREGQKGSGPVCYYHENWYDWPDLNLELDAQEHSANDFFGGDLRGIEEKLPYIERPGRDGSVPEPHLPLALEPQVRHRQLFAGGPSLRHGGGSALFVRGGEEARHPRDPRRRVFTHGGGQRLLQQIRHLRRADGRLPRRKEPYRAWYRFPPVAKGLRLLVGLYDAAQPSTKWTRVTAPFINGEDGVAAHWIKAGTSGWRLDVADEIADALFARAAPPREEHRRRGDAAGEVWEDPTTRSLTARRAATARATRWTA